MIAVTNACLDALAHMQTRVHMLVAGTHTHRRSYDLKAYPRQT